MTDPTRRSSMVKGKFAGEIPYVEMPNKYYDAGKIVTKYRRELEQMGDVARPLWLSDVVVKSSAVDARMDAAASKGAIPMFVVYFIWLKDNGSYSAKGAAGNEAQYYEGIDRVCAGIAGRRCIIILEPDGLAMVQDKDRFSEADRIARERGLATARAKLEAAGAIVYVDAGSSNWIDADEIAAALTRVGATSFSLNVANTRPIADDNTYAQAIRAIMGNHVTWGSDTGRNGQGALDQYELEPGDQYFIAPDHEDFEDAHWLNVEGRGCGYETTFNVSQLRFPGCDWLMWVKSPGGSDGDDHRGNPPAGTFMPYVALCLRARSKPRMKLPTT